MAESPLIDTKTTDTTIAKHVAKLSDRAIQRVTGGNAFLRGRLYARRGAVAELTAAGTTGSAKIMVRQDQPYQVQVGLTGEGQILSQCTCPAWRGPTGHCKHVAALLVALRDRERPPRKDASKDDSGPKQSRQSNGKSQATQATQARAGQGPTVVQKGSGQKASGQKASGQKGSGKGPQVQTRVETRGAAIATTTLKQGPSTVSSTSPGKRRRSRRRRRGAGAEGAAVTEVSAPMMRRGPSGESRVHLEAWLPPEAAAPAPLEFRLAVRPAAIAVTVVRSGSRATAHVGELLSGFNVVHGSMRPLLRAIQRHTSRSAPATAEVRGEDAAEILNMLRDKRVLLEPASMEVRFLEEELKPKLELDNASGTSARVRLVFEQESGGRRFSLSSGAWFEGTPGWHLDTAEGVARPIAEKVTPAWLQGLYRSPALLHPLSDLSHLLTEFLPRVAGSLGAPLPELDSIADMVDEPPAFDLRAGGDLVEARARIAVSYGEHEFEVPLEGHAEPLARVGENESGKPIIVRREVGEEMIAVQELLNRNFEVEDDELVARGDVAIDFWSAGIGELPEDWNRHIPDDLVDVTIRNTPVTAQMRVSSGVDWLDLDMSFDAGGIAVSEEELRMCLEQGRRLVELEDGSYAPVKAEQVGAVLERMAEIYAGVGEDEKKLPLSQAGRVQDLMRMVSDQSVATSTKTLFGKLDDTAKVTSVAKPRTLKATLRAYQKEGFSWLAFLHNMATGGILADDMGLGKTIQAIALLLWVKGREKKALNLVVAPTSVVTNWAREIEKFAPSFKTVVWQGTDRHNHRDALEDADVMITSYALLRRDEELLQEQEFRYVILDEAQHIKNPMSATARAAKRLRSQRRLAMTGTPIENSLSEIWSIFDFVSPGLLSTLKSFEERYARPIDRADEAAAVRLRSTIHPFVLRRTKSEVVKELPDKIEQEILVPMAEEQTKLYKQIRRQIRESLMSDVEKQGVQKSSIQILAALTRLRQVACDPRLLNLKEVGGSDEDSFSEESGKLNALREIITEAVAGGHRMLVFSQFVSMLKLIKESLDELGVSYLYLDGQTKDRQSLVDRFNEEDDASAFLISLKAGGTGLNLTGADTVIHFDPWWNPAVEDQATDRAHRIGQTKVVNVYRLIARGSVEEKILQLSAKKRSLMENVLHSEGAGLKGLTKQDVENLFAD